MRVSELFEAVTEEDGLVTRGTDLIGKIDTLLQKNANPDIRKRLEKSRKEFASAVKRKAMSEVSDIVYELRMMFQEFASSLKEGLNEDWGSSDWYPVMRKMEELVRQEFSVEEAARDCADLWYKDMGYEDPEDAVYGIIRKFRMLVKNPPKAADKHVDEGRAAKGMWVIKNKDGVEKRFKDDESPEAKAWKESSSRKESKAKIVPYSREYWERKEDAGVELLPWTSLRDDMNASDEITKIVDDQFSEKDIELDWTFNRKISDILRDGVPCAAAEVRVSYQYGPGSDLGNEEPVSDAQNIIIARNSKNPKKIDFIKYSS